MVVERATKAFAQHYQHSHDTNQYRALGESIHHNHRKPHAPIHLSIIRIWWKPRSGSSQVTVIRIKRWNLLLHTPRICISP